MGDDMAETSSRRGDAGADRDLGIRSREARQRVKEGWRRLVGMDACLVRRPKTGMRVENWLRRAVQISLRVEDGMGSRETEGEGDGSRKKSNGGTGFKIRH